MSDITIPGVNGSLDVSGMVSKLMEVERIPLVRKEEELENYKNEKIIWQDINRNLSNLGDKAKSLYGSNNPFIERAVVSSNESVLTATAERGALEQEKTVRVIQKARSDRFLSSNIDENFKAPSGTYSFSVGEEEISFNYRGGSLKRLADRINSKGNNVIRAQIIKNTPDTSVMLIESMQEGTKNQMSFKSGAALEFAKQAGFIKQSDPSLKDITPTPSPDSKGVTITEKGVAVLSQGAKGQFKLDTAVEDKGNTYLQIEVLIMDTSSNWSPPPRPRGPETPASSGVDLRGVKIENTESMISLPEWEEPEEPEIKIDFNVFSCDYKGKNSFLPPLKDSIEPQKVLVKLSDIGGRLSNINFENNNTNKEILISNIKLFDPNVTREWEAANPLDRASNSIVEIDGIEIEREGNILEDVIPGVTISLKDESDEPVELKITTDKELIKDGIIKFIGTFNRVQAEISILTSTDSAVISEIDYFTEEEVETARERLGKFQGDSTLIQMKSRLQNILMNPYANSADENLRLLSQIGISTNSAGFSGGFNPTQLRGYIEISEEKLDEALENNINGVKELFGSDTNGDLIIDQGAAFKIQDFTRAYYSSNGIFSYKISSIDTKMDRTRRDISNYELKLEDKEAELRKKYTQMEGALSSMQQTSNSLQNFGNSGSN